MILAITSSHERMGVTMSCSIVPRSRSLTMAAEVRVVVVIIRIIAIRAGIML